LKGLEFMSRSSRE